MLPELLSESIVINAPGCECNEERDDPDIPSAVGRAKAGAKASCCSFLTQWVHEEASIAAHAGLLDERPLKGARKLQSNNQCIRNDLVVGGPRKAGADDGGAVSMQSRSRSTWPSW